MSLIVNGSSNGPKRATLDARGTFPAKERLLRARAVGCVVLFLLVTSACHVSADEPARPPVAVAGSEPAVGGAANTFGGTDMAWIQLTIAMDESLLPLLDLVPSHGDDMAIRALAAQVKTHQEAELATLRQLHDQAGLTADNPHKGMPMPGMVSGDDLAEARAAHGPAFDALLLTHLRAHLDQGVSLATSEQKAGVEPRTVALAKQVQNDRAGRRQQVDRLRRS
jgi:uncharacterized protein (DUF305 family)